MVARLSSFFGDVLGTLLAGFSTASAAAVAAGDSVLVALGKLQAQGNLKLAKTGDAMTGGTINGVAIGGTTPAAGAFTTLTMTGILNLTAPAGNVLIILGAGAGSYRYTQYNTVATIRWQAGVNNATESGSNAGSDYYINCWNDAGSSLIAQPLTIKRSTGLVTLGNGAVIANGASTIDSAVIGGTTPAAGAFTTLSAASLTLAAINGTAIGNTTPAAGAFTALSSTAVTAIAGVAADATLDLNFLSGVLDSRVTLVRAAGGATYFDATGTLQSAAANAGRFDHDPVTLLARGLLIEDGRVNSIRNPRAEGAVAGSPGTLPTNWAQTQGTGITPAVIGFGFESGEPYIDLQFSGTATASSNSVWFETTTGVAALTGQTWTASQALRIVGGTLTNITTIANTFYEDTSAGAFVTGGNIGNFIGVTTGPLAAQRFAGSYTTSGGGTVAFLRPAITLFMSAGAVNVTLRIGAPQLELGVSATSIILPPVGLPAATTRAIDAVSITLGSWYNQAAGSIVVEAIAPLTLPVASSRSLFEIFDSGNNANRFFTAINGGSSVLDSFWVNGSSQPNNAGGITSPALTAGARLAAGMTMTSGSWSLALNGAVYTSASAGFLPSTMTTLNIGGELFSPQFNNWMRRLRYWARTLSATELQQVTGTASNLTNIGIDQSPIGSLVPAAGTFTTLAAASVNAASVLQNGVPVIQWIGPTQRTLGDAIAKAVAGTSILIHCYGDSITEGYMLSGTGGTLNSGLTLANSTWPASLSAALAFTFAGIASVTVQNFGYSGDTTQMGYTRWGPAGGAAIQAGRWTLAQAIPDVGIVSFGYNDANGYGGTTATVAQCRAYTALWFQRIFSVGAVPILYLQPPIRGVAANRTFQPYRDAQVEVAKAYGVLIIDGGEQVNWMPNRWQADGVHLANIGYNELGWSLAALLNSYAGQSVQRVAAGTVMWPEDWSQCLVNSGSSLTVFAAARTGYLLQIFAASTLNLGVYCEQDVWPIITTYNAVGSTIRDVSVYYAGNGSGVPIITVKSPGTVNARRRIVGPKLHRGYRQLGLNAVSNNGYVESIEFVSDPGAIATPQSGDRKSSLGAISSRATSGTDWCAVDYARQSYPSFVAEFRGILPGNGVTGISFTLDQNQDVLSGSLNQYMILRSGSSLILRVRTNGTDVDTTATSFFPSATADYNGPLIVTNAGGGVLDIRQTANAGGALGSGVSAAPVYPGLVVIGGSTTGMTCFSFVTRDL